jgi:hypothetical protein
MGTGSALGGGGHFGFELFIFYDPADKESVYAMGPQPLVFHLQRRIKELLDPNDIGDRMYTWLPKLKR